MNHPTGSRAGIDVVLPVSELPDWLNPIFVRDLRQGLRASFFEWAFVLLHCLALVAAMTEWAMVQFLGSGGMLFASAFSGMASLVFGLFLPLSLFHSLQSELGRGRNAELLYTSRLTRWQIVRGKMFVATAMSALLLVSLLPYFLIRYFLGGIEPFGMLFEMMALLLSNAAMNSIVIGASAFGNYVTRVALIIFLMNFHSIIAAVQAMGSGFAGRMPATIASPREAVAQISVSLLFIILGLQLGRAKLNLHRAPTAPVATVLAYVFASPIAYGIALATGHPLFADSLLILAVVRALFLDRDTRTKKS